jgi:hypothetical protein
VAEDAGARGEIEVSVGLIKRMLQDQYDHIPNLTSGVTAHVA